MIVGWRSPLDGRVYELDNADALTRLIPAPVLHAMTRRERTDTRHAGTNVTITGGLSCPRKTFITRALPITPDPLKMWKLQRGTWLHEMIGLTLSEDPNWVTEEGAPNDCTFVGKLFGIPLSCRVDAYRKDFTELLDWKFRGDGAENFVDSQGVASESDSAQVNMARMLMEQSLGTDLSAMRMHVWVMAGVPMRTTAPVLNLDQIGAIKPGGGNTTVREIFEALSSAMSHWKLYREWKEARNDVTTDDEMQACQEIASSMPLTGLTMFRNKRGGNMCTAYCEVKDICDDLAGGL